MNRNPYSTTLWSMVQEAMLKQSPYCTKCEDQGVKNIAVATRYKELHPEYCDRNSVDNLVNLCLDCLGNHQEKKVA